MQRLEIVLSAKKGLGAAKAVGMVIEAQSKEDRNILKSRKKDGRKEMKVGEGDE